MSEASETPRRYSRMPAEGRRTWIVARWMKEAFVVFALACVAIVVTSKVVAHLGGALERAKGELDADDMSGAPALPFQLPRRGGGTVDLTQLRGKVVLLNFWATWCPPCRDEEPSLAKLAEQFDPGTFEVIAVSVDEGWQPVDTFFGDRKPSYQVALDQGAQISARYGTTKFPESYLIDARGGVQLKFIGPRNWLDPAVGTLLAKYGVKPKRS